MDKIDALNQVAEFHKTFNAPILDTPQIPSKERCELRISLLQEELNELKDAIADNNIIEVADALCDLQYVLSGAVLKCSMKYTARTCRKPAQISRRLMKQ